MSSVRRAMAEMGLAGCCAWCDAPDTPGSERCRTCIATHRSVRDRLAAGADAPIDQAARRLLSLMAEPHRHDHDPVHGPVLKEQIRRLGISARNQASTQADVEAAFAASRARDKGSVVTSVGNRLGDAPEADTARQLGEAVFDPEQINAEARRTIPSRPIATVDRSDRLGEDPALEARISGERKAAEEPVESLRSVVEKAHVEGSIKRREALGGLLDEVDDLLEPQDEN
ncbi:MAG: hypothetical protein ACPIFP_02260 [Candidatus Poseidoniaceae archaeon]